MQGTVNIRPQLQRGQFGGRETQGAAGLYCLQAPHVPLDVLRAKAVTPSLKLKWAVSPEVGQGHGRARADMHTAVMTQPPGRG